MTSEELQTWNRPAVPQWFLASLHYECDIFYWAKKTRSERVEFWRHTERNSWWNNDSSFLLGLHPVCLSWTIHLSMLPAMPEALLDFLSMILQACKSRIHWSVWRNSSSVIHMKYSKTKHLNVSLINYTNILHTAALNVFQKTFLWRDFS